MNIKRNPLIVCADCGERVRRTGPSQRLCVRCGYARKLAYSRRHLRAQRVARGGVVRGALIICARCSAEIVKTGVNQKYCAGCAAAQAKEDHKGASERYRAAHPYSDKERARKREYDARRYGTDPRFALRSRIVCGLNQSLRARLAKGSALRVSSFKNGRKWSDIVGWTVEDLIAHLESRFAPGMTWENRREWHIDHIRPLSSFAFSTPDDPQFREAWALSNLQPLWGIDNLRKGART